MSAQIKQISTEEFLSLKQTRSVLTLDCTWYPAGKNGYAEYQAEHIADARYFRFSEVTSESQFPQMLPKTYKEFAEKAGKQGLKRSDFIVVYDQVSFLSAPRVAYLLATFGHPNVFLLDNYQAYKQLGGKLESGDSPEPTPTEYSSPNEAEPSVGSWLGFDDMLKLLETNEAQKYNIIDARANARFTGAEKEPRPGIQSGHIAGSKNIPFANVVNKDGHFKSKKELEELFEVQGLDPKKPSIILCGSGVTACVVKAAVDDAFGGSSEIYDGSWSEWGQIGPSKYIE